MGFEGFKVVDRAASEGQHPRTGEKIHILRSKTVKFSPGRVPRIKDILMDITGQSAKTGIFILILRIRWGYRDSMN
jgi:hypothetical protein